MKINTTLIKDLEYRYAPEILSHEHVVLIMIIFWHKNNLISRERMISMFKNLREGKLLRKINTYHCPINDTWHSDESMYTVLKEVFFDTYKKMTVTTMELEEFIKYVQLYDSKPRNYSIDYIYTNIVRPFIDRYKYDSNPSFEQLKSFDINFSDVEFVSRGNYHGSSFGYCCEDCSGDYDEYMDRQYEREVVESNKKGFESSLKAAMRGYRKAYKGGFEKESPVLGE